MIKGTIKLGDREVNVLFCYATELNFFTLAKKNIDKFDCVANPMEIVWLILSATVAYDEYTGIDQNINDKNIVFEAKQNQILDALTTITEMRKKWYSENIAEESTPEDEKKNN